MTTFIGLLDPNTSPPPPFTEIVRLKDPSGEEERLYLIADGSTIYELIRVQGDDNGCEECTSQFVGTSLVINQPIYTISPVDPLFWMLSAHDESESSSQWQPMDQILAATASCCVPIQMLQPYIDRTQLGHLYQCMNIGGSADYDEDGECFFKFCPNRALKWLTRKQLAVQEILLDQAAAELGSVNCTKGSFAEGFNLSGDLLSHQQQENLSQQQCNSSKFTQRAKDESVQIVCQYLNEKWRERFLNHLQVTRTSLIGSPKAATKATLQPPTVAAPSLEEQLMATGTATSALTANNVNKPPPKKQKLKPSDAKGTKKLTSFFTRK